MNGIITGVDEDAKKITAELDNGEEHSYFFRRLKFSSPAEGEKITLKKGSNGVEIYRLDAPQPKKKTDGQKKEKTVEKPEKKTPQTAKNIQSTRKPARREEYEEEDADQGYDSEEDEYEDGYDGYDGEGYYNSSGMTGAGLAGFVFSVASFIFGLIPAVIGLVISKKASENDPGDRFAEAGYKISKVQTVIFIIITAMVFIFGARLKKSFDSIKDIVKQTTTQTEGTGTDTGSTSSSSIDAWIETD